VRKEGQLDLALGSQLAGTALVRSPVDDADRVWAAYPTHQFGGFLGVGFQVNNGCGMHMTLYDSGDLFAACFQLDALGIPYDGEDIQFYVAFQIATAPGAGDEVKWRVASRLIPLDGTATLLQAAAEPETTIDISGWNVNEMHMVALNTLAGVAGAKMLNITFSRGEDNFAHRAETFGVFWKKV